MNNITNISAPLKFKYEEHIMWYDGPLITLCITPDNHPILQIWLDCEDNNENHEHNYHLYAYVFIKKEDLLPFVNDQKFYYDVLKDSQEIICWKYNQQQGIHDFENMNKDYFLKHYGPKRSVSLKSDLKDFNKSFQHFLKNDLEFQQSLSQNKT